MRLTTTFMTAVLLVASAAAQEMVTNVISRERIRIVRQDISKWDKNHDGKLTGKERDEFLKERRKQMAQADAAARAARVRPKASAKVHHGKPPRDPADIGKPAQKGIPKNLEGARK